MSKHGIIWCGIGLSKEKHTTQHTNKFRKPKLLKHLFKLASSKSGNLEGRGRRPKKIRQANWPVDYGLAWDNCELQYERKSLGVRAGLKTGSAHRLRVIVRASGTGRKELAAVGLHNVYCVVREALISNPEQHSNKIIKTSQYMIEILLL